MDVLRNRPFRNMISNLSNKPLHIPKLMHVALLIDVPQKILTFTVVQKIETVNAFTQYKEKKHE